MIVTTTNSIEEKKIVEYHGTVFEEGISGINMFKDIAASFQNMGANAIVGADNGMMISASGTVVTVE